MSIDRKSTTQTEAERGSALVLVLMISSVVLLLGLGVSFIATAEIRVAALSRDQKAARYVAEQGLKQAEDALFASWAAQRWDDDLDSTGALGRPAHANGDQVPLSLGDTSLARNGLVVYRWDPANPGTVAGDLYQVPVVVRNGNARYSVWVRNNEDDYSSSVFQDTDSVVRIVSLGEVLDISGGVRARSFLSETLSLKGNTVRNYNQKGFGAAGTSTIED